MVSRQRQARPAATRRPLQLCVLLGGSITAYMLVYREISPSRDERPTAATSRHQEILPNADQTSADVVPLGDGGRRRAVRSLRALSALSAALDALAVPIAATNLAEATLQCVDYSGPCFFMNHPNGSAAPTKPVLAAARPDTVESQLRLHPTAPALRPFSLHNVSLLSGTRFHNAQHTNLEWLHQLDPDRLLYYYRNLSGLPQPPGVVAHGGWDGAGTGLRGHILGHYMTAASMAAATAGDSILLRRLEYITASLDQCQRAGGDGYLAGFPREEFAMMENVPAPPYAWVSQLECPSMNLHGWVSWNAHG